MSREVKRVMRRAAVFAALAAMFSVRAGADAVATEPSVETAQAALKPFKRSLMAALQEGLAQGPEAAIDACRIQAPRIASELASRTLRVGRTSHRLRNPANAPKPWMRPLLDELLEAAPGERSYRMVRIDPEWVGYAEAIYVQTPCLTCHGSDLAPAISERLSAAYPQDQATGFAVGDFRGIFWVESKEDAEDSGAGAVAN